MFTTIFSNCIRVSVVLLCLLLTFTGRAQSYQPIPETGIVWQEYQFRTSIPCITYSRFLYYFDGDTFIAGKKYQKLFLEGNSSTTCSGNSVTTYYPKQYEGAFRQDSMLQTVYFLINGNSAEQILYDFSLTTGDSLYFLENNFNDNGWIDIISNPAVIESVDSVLIDGTYRKRMKYLSEYDACGGPGYVIEGIGNTKGFIFPRMYPCSIYKLLECVTVDGIQVYGLANTCYQPGDLGYSNITDPEMDKSSLFFATYEEDQSIQIHYNGNDMENTELSVINLSGNMVKNLPVNRSGLCSIKGNELLPGFYLVVLKSKKNNLACLNIVIH